MLSLSRFAASSRRPRPPGPDPRPDPAGGPPDPRQRAGKLGLAPLSCTLALSLVLALLLQAPAQGQWWRGGKGDGPVKYGIRFLATDSDAPVKAPLTQVRVGERHRIRVALYAIRNGEIDTSKQLAQGPRGSVAVRCESANPRLVTVEPAESHIVEGYDTAFAEFWLTGVSPGEVRITARAALGGGATATTWFGPLRVESRVVATPKRLPPPKPAKPAAKPAEPEGDPAAAADPAVPQRVVRRGPARPTLAQIEKPDAPVSVTTNPMAVAAGVGVQREIPDTLRPAPDRVQARPAAEPEAPVPPAQAAPARPAPPVEAPHPTTPGEAARPAVAPVAPVRLPPASSATGQELFVDQPAGAADLGGTAAPGAVPPAPGGEAPPPALAPALTAAPEPAPPPCPRFSALTIRNVGSVPVSVQVRDSGAAAPRVERLAVGAILALGLERGDTVWIEAQRADGERQGTRLQAGAPPPQGRLTMPAFATDPWLTIEPTLADCTAP